MEQVRDRRPGLVLLLLALGLVCEGFDLQIANFAAPDLIRMLQITKLQFAPFASASLAGMLVGGLLIGWAGDRIGRKQVIVGGTIAYALLTLLSTRFDALAPLIAVRFLTGIALGGVMPNIMALASDVVAPDQRTKAVAIIGIGISGGGFAAGSVATALAGASWQLMFAIAGTLPLAMAAILWVALPGDRVRQSAEVTQPVAALFADGRRWVTPAIWLVFVVTLMTVYLLTSWLPVMLQENGVDPRSAAEVATTYQLGSMLGCVATALIIGPSGWRQVSAFAACTALALAATSYFSHHVGVVTAGLLATGFFLVGAQNGLNGATAAVYPVEARATGLGWGLGLGRIGSVIGPPAGAFAATLSHDVARTVLGLQVIPLLLAAGAALWISNRLAR